MDKIYMCVCVYIYIYIFGLPWSLGCKEPTYNAGDLGSNPGRGDPLDKGMATHSSILAWRILWTEEPGGLESTGSKRVGRD